MKKILLVGHHGMLATDFQTYNAKHFEIIGVDRNEMDITKREETRHKIQEIQPDIILNCAAYTNVDEAEESGKIMNVQVNALGVYHLAKIAKEQGSDFITISTDYVFDGEKAQGYKTSDTCNPLNAYGMAKYLGEELAKTEFPSTIIVRTSWLYGGGSAFKNFPNTMLHLAETKESINVVNDQFGLPTFTKDLSGALQTLIEQIEQWRGNIFHCSNSGESAISRFDFATEIFKLTEKKIRLLPCSSAEFPTKASRPKRSKLINDSSIQLREWKEGLKEYLSMLA